MRRGAAAKGAPRAHRREEMEVKCRNGARRGVQPTTSRCGAVEDAWHVVRATARFARSSKAPMPRICRLIFGRKRAVSEERASAAPARGDQPVMRVDM